MIASVLLIFFGGIGCFGTTIEDGSSISVGTHSAGGLWRGSRIPFDGVGYSVPLAWRGRGANYATVEMANALSNAFANVNRLFAGSKATLGDVSRIAGGSSVEHKSHHNGRDADVFFYVVDEKGRPFRNEKAMLTFGPDGWAKAWSPPKGVKPPLAAVPRVRFDRRRNWALVRALLTGPGAEVQWIFIHRDLRAELLAQAEREGEAPDLVLRASALLHQPGDSAPHDDHFHVRVYCDPSDRAHGCDDRGPLRWLKKYWKYMPPGGAPADADEPGERVALLR